MKKKLAVLVLGAFLVTGLFGCGNKVPDGTVATVNGEPISQEMLDANYTQYLQMFQMYGADITTDEVKVAAQKAALETDRCISTIFLHSKKSTTPSMYKGHEILHRNLDRYKCPTAFPSGILTA